MANMNVRSAMAATAMVVTATLLMAAIIGRARRASMLQEYLVIPVGSKLFSHPGGMPGNGFSGRANNEEDYTDPYGGGDRPGPYGYVNDPYDGDWALGPLGGKAIGFQSLRSRNLRPNGDQDVNIWGAEPMGTNSIFMPRLTAKDAQDAKNAREESMKRQQSIAQPPTPEWVGTNAAFFGANGGGNGWARKNKINLRHKRAQKALKARMQSLFRSDDPQAAEYGLEGDNQLNDDVLPSAVGTGGPVIGVDGVPSNEAHSWNHYDDPLDFKCSDDILGCSGGLTVDSEYANDLKGVDY